MVQEIVLGKQRVEVVCSRILETEAGITGDDTRRGAGEALFPCIVAERQRPMVGVDEVEEKGIRERIDAAIQR